MAICNWGADRGIGSERDSDDLMDAEPELQSACDGICNLVVIFMILGICRYDMIMDMGGQGPSKGKSLLIYMFRTMICCGVIAI